MPRTNYPTKSHGHKPTFWFRARPFFLTCCMALLALAGLGQPLPVAGDSRNLNVAPVRPSAVAEKRLALVIGNGNYRDAPLRNPVNDATAIARALRESGFQVTEKHNVSQGEMRRLIREFGDRLRTGGGVGLFYYAGHGMQVKGRNYLIPVNADIQREDEVPDQAVAADVLLEKMEVARNRLNIVILDACRNNPFARSFRSSNSGLAQMDAPSGTLVAFSTAPGSVAADGSGQNGLYTQHLLTAMRRPGLKIEDVFKRVRVAVKRDSHGKQIPWENTSLEGDFYFARVSASGATPSSPSVQVANIAPAPVPESPASSLPPVSAPTMITEPPAGIEVPDPIRRVLGDSSLLDRGLKIKAPIRMNSGSVVPVSVSLDKPLSDGDVLYVVVEDKFLAGMVRPSGAAQLHEFSTRVKITSSGPVAFVVVDSHGDTRVARQMIRVDRGGQQNDGQSRYSLAVRTRNRTSGPFVEIVTLVGHSSTMVDHVRTVTVNGDGAGVMVSLTPVISIDPLVTMKLSPPSRWGRYRVRAESSAGQSNETSATASAN